MKGVYLGARFEKPFKSSWYRSGRDCSEREIKTTIVIPFHSATVVNPTQNEISKMLEMSLNRENGMKRCCSSS
jgi:hypothetical protein